jgi:hypothetical protein
MAATPSRFATLSSDALWFFNTGVLIVVVALLNLLNRAYGDSAPGLKRACVAINVVNLGLTVVGGVVSHARVIEWAIVLVIVVPLTVLSASLSSTQRPPSAGLRA